MIVAEIEADGLMSQLADEVVDAYDDYDTITNIVTALLAFQRKTTQVTIGTIDNPESRALAIENDSLLSALFTLHNSVGGYLSVDNNRALQWLDDIGVDTGQQIRYRKNLKGIIKETKYSELCTRLFPLGSGDNKLSDIDITDETAAKSSDASYGYLTLVAQYACYLGWTGLGDALPSGLDVSSGEIWVSPTGHNADGDWENPTNAYDNNDETVTKYDIIFDGWTTTFELTLPETTSSKLKCKLMKRTAPETVSKVKIEIFYTGAYHDAYESDFLIAEWFEVSYGQEDVSKVRFSFFNTESFRAFPMIFEVKVFDDTADETGVWHQGADEHILRCAIGDYDGGKDYKVSYTHADYIIAWDKIPDVISKVLTNKYEAYVSSMLVAARLLMDEIKEAPISYKIDTLDLVHNADFDFSFDALQLGSIITVIDEELGIDVSVRVVSITHPDLLYPEKMIVVLSTKVDTISDYLADMSRRFS